MASGFSFSSVYENQFKGGVPRATGSSKFGGIPYFVIDQRKEGSVFSWMKERESARSLIRKCAQRRGEEGVLPRNAREERVYRFNKKVIFRKAMAFSSLRASEKFLAFLTISFPQGIRDEAAYEILNIFLTAARRDGYMRDYIWVAERQANGTIHFHILTNTFFPVRRANRAVAASIDRVVDRGLCSWGGSSRERYNGVDIKRVRPYGSSYTLSADLKTRRKVCSYLAKYMAKAEQEGTRRLWHCSRGVSALVVSAVIDEIEGRVIINQAMTGKRFKYAAIAGEGYCYYGVVINEAALWYYITRVNELIYRYINSQTELE